MEIRNIAIIAHVDHGKTALTDALMRQTGMFVEGMSMDTNALEQERGITIYAKNTALFYEGTKINIVDTPGHADFGSEVERVLRSIDSLLLVVDAQEGPMPQTRFVLNKSLELGLKPIVVISKIDKTAADPGRAEEEVLELFLELGATEEQADFTTVYAIGRSGIAKRSLADESKDLTPLLDTILEKVAPASHDPNGALQAQPFNLGYDDYLGRLAICRIYRGSVKTGSPAWVKKPDGRVVAGKITKLFTFEGLSRKEAAAAQSGDIVMIAGLPDIYIGDTVGDQPDVAALPSIEVDEPTTVLNFLVNTSPFAGREGKFVTSRQIRERLERELEVNVGLRVEFSSNENFRVFGRGVLHIAILLENMRREGYEMQVSQPQVILKEEDAVTMEPYEEMTIDVPGEYQGAVISKLGPRGAILKDVKAHETRVRLIFEGPTRGIIGYRNQFIIDTRGRGILASRVIGFRPYSGEIQKRRAEGSMVSMMQGKAAAFALDNLQSRGTLYIGPGTDVYEGMVVGNTSKGEEMMVNPVKGKQLTNMRASGSDKAIHLEPPKALSIETGLEIMQEDEYLETTPKSVRLRKQQLAR
ncbi:MAG: translational GTPase TypA [Armatimonadota bacterium]